MSIDKPNIHWICTDPQRYDTIGALGTSYVSTPNIDSLVEEGVAFTHAYCQSSQVNQMRIIIVTLLGVNTTMHWIVVTIPTQQCTEINVIN